MAEDQFGRPWSYQIEIATGDPTGLINAAGWHDPLRTPQKYLKPKNAFGMQAGSFMVDFPTWITDHVRAMGDWQQQLMRVAQLKYPGGISPEDAEQNPWLAILTGPKPWPSVEALKAAMQGDTALLGWDRARKCPAQTVQRHDGRMVPADRGARKLLGVETVEDTLAAASGETSRERVGTEAPGEDTAPDTPPSHEPPKTWPEFVKWARQTGQAMNTTEAGKLWSARKAGV
jgi:hypothetical protein